MTDLASKLRSKTEAKARESQQALGNINDQIQGAVKSIKQAKSALDAFGKKMAAKSKSDKQ